MDKVKGMVNKFKDPKTGNTGEKGVMDEGKERFQEYQKDKADGQVNWKQEGTDAFKDIKAGETGGGAGAAPPK